MDLLGFLAAGPAAFSLLAHFAHALLAFFLGKLLDFLAEFTAIDARIELRPALLPLLGSAAPRATSTT